MKHCLPEQKVGSNTWLAFMADLREKRREEDRGGGRWSRRSRKRWRWRQRSMSEEEARELVRGEEDLLRHVPHRKRKRRRRRRRRRKRRRGRSRGKEKEKEQ